MTKRPVGRQPTPRGTAGARLTIRLSLVERKALDERAAIAETSAPVLVRAALDKAGLFRNIKRL